jgi:ParB/RepB/Spo0J family partition protein
MAKLQGGSGLRKIPLSQIKDTSNVRFEYRDIEELAESIKKNGQLEPALVKPLDEKDGDGLEMFELVAGHRRARALRLLLENGEGFTTIDAIVVQGDTLTIQLVENLQRSDLTATERETGIYRMCENGLSQKEVAARLSKNEIFVSRNVSAYKIRGAAEAMGVDTAAIATGTLNEIRAAEAVDYPELVKEIVRGGGTLEVARAVMENYRVAHGKPANPRKSQTQELTASPSLGLHPSPVVDPLIEQFGGEAEAVDIDMGTNSIDCSPGMPENKPPEEPAPVKKEAPGKAVFGAWADDFNPPHKQVDFNDVCLAIINYGKKFEVQIAACKKYNWQNGNAKDEGCECADLCGVYFKHEAAMDIIALLHAEL